MLFKMLLMTFWMTIQFEWHFEQLLLLKMHFEQHFWTAFAIQNSLQSFEWHFCRYKISFFIDIWNGILSLKFELCLKPDGLLVRILTERDDTHRHHYHLFDTYFLKLNFVNISAESLISVGICDAVFIYRWCEKWWYFCVHIKTYFSIVKFGQVLNSYCLKH